MADSISFANQMSGASTLLLDSRVYSSSSVRSTSPALSFRNANARLRSKNSRLLPLSRAEFLGVAVCGFGSVLGLVRWGQAVEKRRWGGLASVRADATAIVETEEAETNSSEKEILTRKLLSLVEGTDRGALLVKERQADVATVVEQLEEYGIPEPLQSPLIFGDWDVAYSSNPTSSGGGYRSWFGRLVFRTKDMIQTFSAPDVVVNIVRFALFGFMTGQVILQGKLQALDKKWVQVDFEPPSIEIGPFKIQYGKISSLKISIIYLDDKIRLGRGSRGTVFVFTRR